MDTPTPTTADDRSVRRRLASLRLRFRDPGLESAFRADTFHLNLGTIRVTFLAGIGLWIGWGLLLRPYILALEDKDLDMLIRYGAFVPLLLAGLALSYTSVFVRIWEWACTVIAIATVLFWVYYASHVLTLPAEFGYIGVILITAFTYTLLRLRFILVVAIIAVGIATYLPYVFTAPYIVDVTRVLATLYLVSFGILGGLAAFRMERLMRDLFIRQRELDQERVRSDGLLLNILPKAVVDQLKASSGERIAQAFDEVSVVFVDAVGSTQQAARSSPDEFAKSLDALFRRFDLMADRHGLEKVKTIGDAYMAVAGAPVVAPDPARAAVAMANDILADSHIVRWPSGDPIVVRGGVATGPAVAGVIGDRRFQYDVWGDTANLAKRLEEYAEPGQILVSDSTAAGARDGFGFEPVRTLDIKGKGPTPVHALLGPVANSEADLHGQLDPS
jgi:class 3 adenylate cyclase